VIGIIELVAAVIGIVVAALSLTRRIANRVWQRRLTAVIAEQERAERLADAAALAELNAIWPEPIAFNVPGESGLPVDLNVPGERWTGFGVE
jgi:tRNA A37 threonylcarbamoyladenosine synthetase subunit TsaC/SUA5/YrdC